MNRLVLNRADIKLVVQLTLSALSRCDLKACVIGSVAAQIHGIEYRDPKVCILPQQKMRPVFDSYLLKDVDLLILNAGLDQDVEEIKQTLIEMDPSHFSLTPSRVAGATHRILWCTLSGDYPGDPSLVPSGPGEHVLSRRGGTSHANATTSRTCKVDILTPNELYMTHHMPELLQLYRDSENTFMAYSDPQPSMPSESHVQYVSYVSLSMLLMLKLRAWLDHSLPSANEIKHGKIPQDEDDIQEILRVGMQDRNMSCSVQHMDDGDTWNLGGFASWRDAERSVRKFVRKWPETANGWRAVGFV